ncbi:uncharacterized protein RCC_03482 [Ramularia collo-cygni]|uniref:Uncharacterized protein n=1 Tax=Ramularia collo-cygni TaxID=112498 RepID=A0A2D3UUB9_9PEZI|nr:uncharacterized protein RCC_03482 [Ramularia collo-cygni]CZT17645.1 uncharacterized protein RCC_03482 [Ramularia collo-cygni]
MPSTTLITTSLLLALTGLIVGYIYIFGVPPEMKKKMERAALKTVGENKASYALKSSISQMPESNQQELNEAKETVGDVAGGSMQNPLGEFVGESADSATAPFTGR